jgi:aubergine-like protein
MNPSQTPTRTGQQPARGRSRGRNTRIVGLSKAPPLSKGVTPGENPIETGSTELNVVLETTSSVQTGIVAYQMRRGDETGTNGNGGNGEGDRNESGGSGSGSPNGTSPAESNIILGRRTPATRGFGNNQIDVTRPDGFPKHGSLGVQKRCIANYFELQIRPGYRVRVLYSVTFDPEPVGFSGGDPTGLRKALLKTRSEEIGPYLYDGAQLFTVKEIPEGNLLLQTVKFPDKEETYTVEIKKVRDVGPMEPVVFMLYNILVRKCQKELGLDLLGRQYFDHQLRVPVPAHRLEMWPGFLTSMRQQDSGVMLNVDMTMKVMRTDTVLQMMQEIRKYNQNNYQAECARTIVGAIVLTKYNRKTYRVDDIDWNTKPTCKFEVRRKGETKMVSFLEYYQSKYQQPVTAPGQPMLVSRPSERDVRRGDTGDKLLLPEFCVMTGLTQEMREDFRLMRDLSSHLHQAPDLRLRNIKSFLKRVCESQKVS